MRFGVLNYLFNTPGLHRWHHSRDQREGNKNYGENLMIWDLIFRTYFDAARRSTSASPNPCPSAGSVNSPPPSSGDACRVAIQPFQRPS